MANRPTRDTQTHRHRPAVDPARFGASISIKQCRNFGLDPAQLLRAAINDIGLRRFRLMSYWDEHEKQLGELDFSQLDQQIKIIEKAGGEITLCLGARQPRWPESHWPDWAWQLSKTKRDTALFKYIETVVRRYCGHKSIISWQLENEALLEEWGERSEVDRQRLVQEYNLVRKLDTEPQPSRPIIMTTSTSWGIPVRQPIPDIVGFSYYRTLFNKGNYRESIYQPWIFRWRARLVKILHQKPCFIHELQAEPWGPKNIWEMSDAEQFRSMNPARLKQNIRLAAKTNLFPIDLWGLEWWYWRKVKANDSGLWNTARNEIRNMISE